MYGSQPRRLTTRPDAVIKNDWRYFTAVRTLKLGGRETD